MKFISSAFFLLLSSCVMGGASDYSAIDSYQSYVGKDYFELRQKLLDDGFIPAAAVCGEKLLCADHEELATNLSNKETCGTFFNDRKESIKVCVDPVPDRWITKSVQNYVGQ